MQTPNLRSHFIKKLASENANQNLFFSPYSISSAFAMAWEGAKGNTAKEIAVAMKFFGHVKTNEAVHAGMGTLNQRFNQEGKPYQLSIANALWGEKTFPFLKSYIDALEKPYGTALFPADFIGNANGERVRINGWVEKKTNNLIKNLLPFRKFRHRHPAGFDKCHLLQRKLDRSIREKENLSV